MAESNNPNIETAAPAADPAPAPAPAPAAAPGFEPVPILPPLPLPELAVAVAPAAPPVLPAATLQPVADARDHLRAVKRLRLAHGDAAATRLDEEAMRVRLHQVEARAAAAGAAPPWAALLFAEMAALRADMSARFDSLETGLRNSRAVLGNGRDLGAPLHEVAKERPGLGPVPAWAPANFHFPGAWEESALVGRVPPSFPHNAPAIMRLTRMTLARFAVFFNEGWGDRLPENAPDDDIRLAFAAFLGAPGAR
ncbi:hypothetical protein HDU86_007311 [Geranomyces michiganensis]|nr:hypothetical protein HDU86_007311 [Geranomyces michiganensis]